MRYTGTNIMIKCMQVDIEPIRSYPLEYGRSLLIVKKTSSNRENP